MIIRNPKTVVIVALLCSVSCLAIAQNPPPKTNKGTIKVQKKGHLAKVIFDDVNYKLLGVDIYGNIMDTAVLEFKMFVTIKGIAYSASTKGPFLSREMQQLLDRRDSRTIIYFKAIKARDRNGTILNMPDFFHSFPYSREED